MPNTWVNEDAFWYVDVPEEAPTFAVQWDRMRLSAERRLGKSAPEDVKRPLLERQFAIVSGCMVRARELHASGKIAEAWGYLSLAIEIFTFNDGQDFAEQLIEISARDRKDAAEYGRQGAQTKAKKAQVATDAIVEDLLRAHELTPFKQRRELRDAAKKRSPHGGSKDSDTTWVSRLLKQPKLAELYASLGTSRAVQINRVTR